MLQSASRGRGVGFRGSVCLLPSGGVVPGPGGSAPGGWLEGGGGCLLWGVSALGGSQHALRQTPPTVDRHTLVKILPWPNFVAAGNKESNHHTFGNLGILTVLTVVVPLTPL